MTSRIPLCLESKVPSGGLSFTQKFYRMDVRKDTFALGSVETVLTEYCTRLLTFLKRLLR